MPGVVCLQLGQCGNQIGSKFWETISLEHGIDPASGGPSSSNDGRERVGSFFHETDGRFIPRAILVDLDPQPLDSIRSGPMGSLFRPENFISGKVAGGTSHNWARGRFKEGAEMMAGIMDAVRKEIEKCDSLLGLQITNALGGGTGSGLGASLLARLREDYCSESVMNFTVLPSAEEMKNTAVAAYNAGLTVNYLINYADNCVFFTNDAGATFDHANQVDADVMAGVTSSMRFPGESSVDYRRLRDHLEPFPRLHFYVAGLAPLPRGPKNLSVPELTRELFDLRNVTCAVNLREGESFAAAAFFRGPGLIPSDVDAEIAKARANPWVSQNVLTSYCGVAPKGVERSGTVLYSHTSVMDPIKIIETQFSKMFESKASFTPYADEGMDDMEFLEAICAMQDSLASYEYRQPTGEVSADVVNE